MKRTPTILIVDDNASDVFVLEEYVREWGYAALTAQSGAEALALLDRQAADLIISDRHMPNMDGLELLRRVKQSAPALPFIMLTIENDISKAIAAMQQGADDYLTKPYDPAAVQAKIERLLHYPWLLQADEPGRDAQPAGSVFSAMLTCSPKMRAVFKLALKVAQSPHKTVLLQGESGVGKELLARAIHAAAAGSEQNFVGVNCAGIPASLSESELFGHVKGAFTGAERNREGKFAQARGGALLFDEIGDMPLDLQAKLLRVLQERTYEPVGSNRIERLDCRVIAATHKDLHRLIETGHFRQDLYYRINDFPITIPPLRERKEDIPYLANHFFERFRREQGKYLPGIATHAMESLFNYAWPGNVRELQKCLEMAVMLADEGPLTPAHLPAIPQSSQLADEAAGLHSGLWVGRDAVRLVFECPRDRFALADVIDYVKRHALNLCQGNKAQAAKLLNVNRKRYYRRKTG